MKTAELQVTVMEFILEDERFKSVQYLNEGKTVLKDITYDARFYKVAWLDGHTSEFMVYLKPETEDCMTKYVIYELDEGGFIHHYEEVDYDDIHGFTWQDDFSPELFQLEEFDYLSK